MKLQPNDIFYITLYIVIWCEQTLNQPRVLFDLPALDGLMSYSIPDGHQMIYRGLDVFFNDSVYDGASAERSEFNKLSLN